MPPPIRLRSRPRLPADGCAYQWTVDEFHSLKDSGWFSGTKAILPRGEIFSMPAAGLQHDVAQSDCEDVPSDLFSGDFRVRKQMGLKLNLRTDPVPDIAVVAERRYTHSSTPSTALLVVEVSDTSIVLDRGEKAGLYAAAGIPEYRVIDINARQLIVHRDPARDGDDAESARY